MEMDLLPVDWEAKKRCMGFWFKVQQIKELERRIRTEGLTNPIMTFSPITISCNTF